MASRRHRLIQRRTALGLTQEQLAEHAGVDRSTAGRWERGESEPQPWQRPRLARTLQVSVEQLDHLLTPAEVDDTGNADGLDDRGEQRQYRVLDRDHCDDQDCPAQLRTTAEGQMQATSDAWDDDELTNAGLGLPYPPGDGVSLRPVQPGERRGEGAAEELRDRLRNAAAVDAQVVALLARQTDHIRQVDRMLGARAAEAQMRGHLEALDMLRSFAVSVRQREALADLYADAVALAGWQCLDLGDLYASWRYHDAARRAGREGRSLSALVHAMAQQAYVLVELNELPSAIQLTEHALSVAGSAVPRLLLSWLSAVQGEVYAVSGDAAACRRAFETAGRLLPDDAHDPQLPYIVLDEVHLARWRGNASAQLGDPNAIDDLRRAACGLDGSFARAKAGLHVDLAWALAAAGRNADARAELHEARTLAVRVGSARRRRRVRRLGSTLNVG